MNLFNPRPCFFIKVLSSTNRLNAVNSNHYKIEFYTSVFSSLISRLIVKGA